MIAVDSRGRLGNHMFQYAFGLAAARALGTDFAFEATSLSPLFVLGPHREIGRRPPRVVAVGNDDYTDPGAVLASVEDETTYSGFFQSEGFFAPARDAVRASFRLRAEHRQAFAERYGELAGQGYTCCHLRRTDYETFAGGVALPMRYYRDALRRAGTAAATTVVFVGDDLEEARAAFGSRPHTRFEQNDEATDLQLIANAQTVIVSNSTFGWWGAWLNERPGRRVLAPRHWLGFGYGWEYPPAVIPTAWEQVAVHRPWTVRLAPSRLRMSMGRRWLEARERRRR